ncbi:hypothetical protein [Brevibacillus reuszeri]|uniref:hypothetical protein n=1 Tax=Brevibacillus reuszeri TaxID=54915 RepID=UPI003D1F5FE4
MNIQLQRILDVLGTKGISIQELLDAINESCDPNKPVLVLTSCEKCQRQVISTNARIKMNEFKETLLLCSSCKNEHERESGAERMRKHRLRKKEQGAGLFNDTDCLEAMKLAKLETGKVTGTSYSEWQLVHPGYPSKEDIESIFGSWKNAKEALKTVSP